VSIALPAFAAVAASAPAAAQAAAPVAQAPATPGLFGAFLALLLVLGLILGLAWLLRRMPGSGLRPAEGLRVVASLQLGPKERAVVVEVGARQLLLGVSGGGVSLLHELAEPLPQAPAPKLPSLKDFPNFAQLLNQRLRKDA
jgi:flagellar protein FliO/FliZ